MFSTQTPPELTPERPRYSRRTLAVIAGATVLLIAATVAFFTLRDSNGASNEVTSKSSSTDLGLFDINSTLPTTEPSPPPVAGPAANLESEMFSFTMPVPCEFSKDQFMCVVDEALSVHSDDPTTPANETIPRNGEIGVKLINEVITIDAQLDNQEIHSSSKLSSEPTLVDATFQTEPVYGPAPKDSVFNPNGSGFCSIWAHKGDTSVRLTCMVQPDTDSSVVTMVVAYDNTQIWSETYIEGRGVVASWSNGVEKTGGFVPIGK